MSKLGKKLIEAAKEGVAIARASHYKGVRVITGEAAARHIKQAQDSMTKLKAHKLRRSR